MQVDFVNDALLRLFGLDARQVGGGRMVNISLIFLSFTALVVIHVGTPVMCLFCPCHQGRLSVAGKSRGIRSRM
jgi:hypothetical protein